MNFEMLRLVLVSREQTSLFEQRSPDGTSLTREGWLRSILNSEIVFLHRGQEFHYTPDSTATLEHASLLIGKIGRQFTSVENSPPETGFREIERQPWRASLVIIDPTHHADGQKVAFETKAHVGNALAIVRALADYINRNHDHPYIIEVNAIVDVRTFWDFERENHDEITSITFELVAPNMFGVRDAIDAEMAGLRDNEKARKATFTLQNQDGLKLNTDRVRETVNYAIDGGGSIKARTKRKRTYNSSKKLKKITVEGVEDIDNTSLSSIIVSAFSTVFGGRSE